MSYLNKYRASIASQKIMWITQIALKITGIFHSVKSQIFFSYNLESLTARKDVKTVSPKKLFSTHKKQLTAEAQDTFIKRRTLKFLPLPKKSCTTVVFTGWAGLGLPKEENVRGGGKVAIMVDDKSQWFHPRRRRMRHDCGRLCGLKKEGKKMNSCMLQIV